MNVDHVTDVGMALVAQASKNFGSWDDALRAAGLDPAKLRAHPPQQQWTRAMVIEALRDFANARQANPTLKMTNSLVMAATRFFQSRSAACQAAGFDYELINPRASFASEEVAKVVAAIRTLEHGDCWFQASSAIWPQGHSGRTCSGETCTPSLRRLARLPEISNEWRR